MNSRLTVIALPFAQRSPGQDRVGATTARANIFREGLTVPIVDSEIPGFEQVPSGFYREHAVIMPLAIDIQSEGVNG